MNDFITFQMRERERGWLDVSEGGGIGRMKGKKRAGYRSGVAC